MVRKPMTDHDVNSAFLPLTPMEKFTAQIIHEWWQLFGLAPTFEQLKHELCLKSKSGVHRLILGLEEKAWLCSRKPQSHYSIKLRSAAPVRLPEDYLFEITEPGIKELADHSQGIRK